MTAPENDNKERMVYCDRDPRNPGCMYQTEGKFITEAEAFQLTMFEGYGLMVKKGGKP